MPELPVDPEKLVDELRANESRPRRLLSQKWAAAGHLDQSRPPSVGRKSVRRAVAPSLRLLAPLEKDGGRKNIQRRPVPESAGREWIMMSSRSTRILVSQGIMA